MWGNHRLVACDDGCPGGCGPLILLEGRDWTWKLWWRARSGRPQFPALGHPLFCIFGLARARVIIYLIRLVKSSKEKAARDPKKKRLEIQRKSRPRSKEKGKRWTKRITVVFSPRMWGGNGEITRHEFGGDVFPTHVGGERTASTRSNISLSSPHVCGGEPIDQYSNRYGPSKSGWGRIGGRMTPASFCIFGYDPRARVH